MKRHSKAAIFFLLIVVLFFLLPKKSAAIPPPDIIIGITQSLLGVLGIAFAFVLTGFYLAKDYIVSIFRRVFPTNKKKSSKKNKGS